MFWMRCTVLFFNLHHHQEHSESEDEHKCTCVKIYKKNIVNLKILSYPSVVTFVLGAQKNHLTETVLLSTHNICFG